MVSTTGGDCSLWVDGENHRVYARRFHHTGFSSQQEAGQAFSELWWEVERLGSAAEVEQAAERWLGRRG